jgi:predicted alpha/beta-hydrolase family hydrolase
VVALAFPLRPPARPERTRVEELDQAVPTLVVQGESDPFGGPACFPSREGLTIVSVPGDHFFVAGSGAEGTGQEVLSLVVERVADWCRKLLLGNADAASRRSRVS